MNKRNILFGALALGATWAQASFAVATYNVDATSFFSTTRNVSDEQLLEGVTVFEPVVITEGNGRGGTQVAPGENDFSVLSSASGSAGPGPLPAFSASEVSGEILVDASFLRDVFDLSRLNFEFDVDLGISVTDPTFSSASAGYEVRVFADDLLANSVQGLIDESDLVNGSASLSPAGVDEQFDLTGDTDFFTVQYTFFGDAVSVEVPEPGVAWLAAAGLLTVGASRRLRR